jgi:hypothetical protein
MDQMVLRGNSPQEDEFALFLLGAPSPYAALLYPELIGSLETLSRLDLITPNERRRWFDIHSRFLERVQEEAYGRPIVLKSPTHSFRISELAEKYSNAKFLYVVRNPYMVFASSRILWREMWKLYGLAPTPDTRFVDHAIAETMISLDAAATRSLASLPQYLWTIVRYEDALQNISETLANVGEELNLTFLKSHSEDRKNAIRNLPAHRRNKHMLAEHEAAFVRHSCAPLFRAYGYDINEIEA